MVTATTNSQELKIHVRCRQRNLYVKPTLLTLSRDNQLILINELENQAVIFRIPHHSIRETVDAGSRRVFTLSEAPKGLYPFQVSTGEQSVSGTLVLHS